LQRNVELSSQTWGSGHAPRLRMLECLCQRKPFRDVPWDDNVQDEELVLDESPSPGEPLFILEDERFRLFQPTTRRDLLSQQLYRSSYGSFLDRMNEAFPTDEEIHS
jgi:hypothetical protein